jgi:UDP-N-acetylmuramate dehydrogenase
MSTAGEPLLVQLVRALGERDARYREPSRLDEALELHADEPMSRHTTLRLGGPADVWCRPRSAAALADVLAVTCAAGIPVTTVGGGTNLLIRDGGIRGVVVQLAKLATVRNPEPDAPEIVEVEAGCSTGRLLKFAVDRELGGVEFLAGVPGSVGGGLVMNAGTFLGEFTSVVEEVRSLRRDGAWIVRRHAECGFRYRDSDLPRDEAIVSARLRLRSRARAEQDADIARLREHRRAREPAGVPNNGSTFKNPPGDHAGRLIEAAGLKGHRVGGAVVSPKHANWLVVDPQASPRCTAADLLALIHHVQREVEARFGVTLQREVKVLGEP